MLMPADQAVSLDQTGKRQVVCTLLCRPHQYAWRAVLPRARQATRDGAPLPTLAPRYLTQARS